MVPVDLVQFRIAFTGAHFRDGAFVQHHAADQLHVEMTLTDRAFGRFAHRGESRNQQVVELAPAASCARNSSVRARKASSDSGMICGSNALIASMRDL